MSQPFGYVDLSKPHTVIEVFHPAVIHPLRRARLDVGQHFVQGNVLSRLGAVRERRMIAAGIFSASFVEPSTEESVRANTIQAKPPSDEGEAEVSRTSVRANAKLGTLAKLLADTDAVSSGGADFRLEDGVLRCSLADRTVLELSPNCLEATDMTVAAFIGSLLDGRKVEEGSEETPDDPEETDEEAEQPADGAEDGGIDPGADLPVDEDQQPREGQEGDPEADGAGDPEPEGVASEPKPAVEEPMDEAALIAANLMAMDAETRSAELANLQDTRPTLYAVVAETLGEAAEQAGDDEEDGPSAADILSSLNF